MSAKKKEKKNEYEKQQQHGKFGMWNVNEDAYFSISTGLYYITV